MTGRGPVSAVHLGLVDPRRPAGAAAAPTAAFPEVAPAARGEAPTAADSAPRLRALADRAAVELAGASATEIVRWAGETFGTRFCVTSSMADGVVAHLVSRVVPGVEVIFLDTGLHFPQTLRVRDEVARTLPVVVRSVRPPQTVGQQDGEYGPRLFHRAPDECCRLRKVEPLQRAMRDFDAWVTGLRRDESPTRAHTPVVAFDAARGKVKINPIAGWTQADVDDYIARWKVPVNELLRQGYGSVGCWPCTRRTRAGEDPRAGRWAMFDKTECGLHT